MKERRALTVGFLPWWPANPYQILLKQELNALGIRVIGNPPLSLLRLLFGRDGLDVVHIHWPHGLYMGALWRFPYVLAVLALYRLLKNNLVWTVHELDFYETKLAWPDRLIRQFLLRRARVLLLHAKASEKELRDRFGVRDRIVLVRHPSYVGFYPDSMSRDQARERLGIATDSRVFLFFGYVKPYKGVEDLIAAFANLRDPESRLLIAGAPLDNRIKVAIETQAASDPRVRTFLRYVADEEIQVFFRAADVVVFPFRRTHTSGSIMLAMTFGKPIVAPEIASIPEYADRSMAELFDATEPEGLARALEAIIDRDLIAMGKAGEEHARRFSWKEMAVVHARAYQCVATRQPLTRMQPQ